MFTGNELAALLGWWMLFNWKEAHPDPADSQKVYMLATTVSSKILQAFARMEGFCFEVRGVSKSGHRQGHDDDDDDDDDGFLSVCLQQETLPGFKWIGNRIHELSKTGNSVIFAFEESIGNSRPPSASPCGVETSLTLKMFFFFLLLLVCSGFLCGSLVPEKDGVSAAAVVAEMAAYLHNKNLSLNQQLHNIYQT